MNTSSQPTASPAEQTNQMNQTNQTNQTNKTSAVQETDEELAICPMCDGDYVMKIDVGVGFEKHYCEFCEGGWVTKGEERELLTRDWQAYWQNFFDEKYGD